MSKFNIQATPINGLYILEAKPHEDERGGFTRLYCAEELQKIVPINIKQINHSVTLKKGTARGLHFQYAPDAEVKIIKCIKGSVYDVVVDIRKNSPTFLKQFNLELTAENHKMLCIPKGLAHGFQALQDNAELIYMHDRIYTPGNEGALNLQDPLLNIDWPLDVINVSLRDKAHRFLDKEFKGIEINEL